MDEEIKLKELTKFKFIGDLHGQIPVMNLLSQHATEDITFQVGDFGVGFIDLNLLDLPTRTWFIEGNHDNHSWLVENNKSLPENLRWIPRNTVIRGLRHTVLCLGGGYSIDKQYRTPGLDWWPDEEPNYRELDEFLRLANDVCPSIIVTHECPSFLIPKIHPMSPFGVESNTAITFTEIFEAMEVKPLKWIFGHHHKPVNIVEGPTEFVGLPEAFTHKGVYITI